LRGLSCRLLPTQPMRGLITSFNQAAADLVGRVPEIARTLVCDVAPVLARTGRCATSILRCSRAERSEPSAHRGGRPAQRHRFPFMPMRAHKASGAVEGGLSVRLTSQTASPTCTRNALYGPGKGGGGPG
jgi:hypothetical protein